jgi:valyl-tRNA synthetase
VREPLPDFRDPDASDAIERMIAATTALRSWRDALGIAPGARLVARIDAEGYDEVAHLLAARARLELRERSSNGGEPQASVPVPGGAVAILEGIDREAHEQRAAKRREKLQAEIARARGKLQNGSFVANAPPEVVAKERAKLADLERELEEL